MGYLLREARGDRTQEEIAFQSGVSQGWISKVELGQVENPSADKIRKVARALGVDERLFFAAQFEMERQDRSAPFSGDASDVLPKPIRDFWLKTNEDGATEEQLAEALDIALIVLQREIDKGKRERGDE